MGTFWHIFSMKEHRCSSVFKMTVRCCCITRHLTPSIMIFLHRWKLTNTSVHKHKERETKRGTEKENIQKIIMKEMMSQLRVEAIHFLQVPQGESSAQCALSFIQRQRSVLSTHYWWCQRLGFLFSFLYLRGVDKSVFVTAC